MEETIVTRYVVVKTKIKVNPVNDMDEEETAIHIIDNMDYNLSYNDEEGEIVETEIIGSTDSEPII
jgi:hypothetical protein